MTDRCNERFGADGARLTEAKAWAETNAVTCATKAG
jgi:hypothetical protein